jgi:signal transduction histidine kinase
VVSLKSIASEINKMKKFFLSLLLFLSLTKTISQHNYYRDSLKQKLASAKEDTAKVNLLFNLSYSYLMAYGDTAITYAKQGVQLAQKIKYGYGEVLCMNMLSWGLTNLGNFTSALDFGFKALALSENLHDTFLIVYSNNALMACYGQQEDYKEALAYGYEAKKLFTSPYADTFQASIVLGIIGSLYEKTNRLDSALYYAERAFELHKGWSGIFKILGDIHVKMGHPDVALNYYRTGVAVATERSEYVGLADMYNDMSKVFESTGKTDSSIHYANKSINQEGIHTYPEGVLRASAQLAHLYESKGMADSTIKYQKLTITLKDSLFSRQKTREAQNFTFNEKLHQQEFAAQQQQEKNKMRMYALLAVIIVFSLIAFFLWRNNRHKQKVNALLQAQKQEIQIVLTELKSTQAQLVQREKMASLGELTAGIAHEIQNPLNFVNNFSEVNKELIAEMKEEIEKGNYDEVKTLAKDVEDNEEKINYHGKRADAIVKGMLQHSRRSGAVKEPTDINKLADEYLRLAYHGLRAKDNFFDAALNTDFDDSIENVNIIPQDIGRVILNLITNAFYAVTEKKKQIGNGYEPAVSVSTKKAGDNILISVKDNGNGIPQKVLDKIFQPFFTTKPTGQGTGLGLSLSYDIVKAHGGELKVETREGEGTVFVIWLPVNQTG